MDSFEFGELCDDIFEARDCVCEGFQVVPVGGQSGVLLAKLEVGRLENLLLEVKFLVESYCLFDSSLKLIFQSFDHIKLFLDLNVSIAQLFKLWSQLLDRSLELFVLFKVLSAEDPHLLNLHIFPVSLLLVKFLIFFSIFFKLGNLARKNVFQAADHAITIYYLSFVVFGRFFNRDTVIMFS